MTDLNDVLERLMTDPGFRRQLEDDPASALTGYDLDESELQLLQAQITENVGAGGSVEQRTSKSALGGALLGLFGGGADQDVIQYNQSDTDLVGSRPGHDQPSAADDRPTEEVSSDGQGGKEPAGLTVGEQPVSEMEIEMKPVIVTSYQTGGSEGTPGPDDLSSPEGEAAIDVGFGNPKEFTVSKSTDTAANRPEDFVASESEMGDTSALGEKWLVADSFGMGAEGGSTGGRSEGELVQAMDGDDQSLTTDQESPEEAGKSGGVVQADYDLKANRKV